MYFLVFIVLIDIAGSVKGLHGGLASWGSRLVLSFGRQAIDLMRAEERREGQSQT